MSLGQNIKQFRTNAHLSQEKLAELVGVSRQAVTKWEADQSAPSTENLFRLAEVLSVTVDDLVAQEAGGSVAEEIYRLYKADEARKKAARRRNLRDAAAVVGGWLVLFLLGRLIFAVKEGYSVLGWLGAWQSTVYLFGWLLSSRLYWVGMAVSAALAAFGKQKAALCGAAGFFLGWAAGELLGPRVFHPQAGVEYHYGFATWGILWLLSLGVGLILEKKSRKASL